MIRLYLASAAAAVASQSVAVIALFTQVGLYDAVAAARRSRTGVRSASGSSSTSGSNLITRTGIADASVRASTGSTTAHGSCR